MYMFDLLLWQAPQLHRPPWFFLLSECWSLHMSYGVGFDTQEKLGPGKYLSILKSSGLSRCDGKRPDSLTLCFAQDVKVSDSYASSHILDAEISTKSTASAAEPNKIPEYHDLSVNHIFHPVVFEMFGVVRPQIVRFLSSLAAYLPEITGEAHEGAWLFQVHQSHHPLQLCYKHVGILQQPLQKFISTHNFSTQGDELFCFSSFFFGSFFF